MRIGINGFFLDRPETGSGQYVRNLLRELADMASGEIFVFCPSEGALAEARRLVPARRQVTLILVRPPMSGNLGKLWFEQVGIPQAARGRIDVLHVPYFGSPLVRFTATVVTVHDLIMLVLPQYRGSVAVRLYTAVAAAAARRANLVLADSECTRRDLICILKLSPSAIRVVYLGCEERFRPFSDPSQKQLVRRKYHLEGPFVLYLGGLDWRKNLPDLVRAFARIEGPWKLAIGGQASSRDAALYPDLKRAAREAGAEDRVRFLGWVSEEDKPALYAAADLFVFPSLYEGFGLPPLEAMACGTPVACSNAASLPEVVNGAALLFDPNREDEMAAAMARALADEGLRAELRQRGLEHAKRFSWRKTAEDTLAAYRAALGS